MLRGENQTPLTPKPEGAVGPGDATALDSALPPPAAGNLPALDVLRSLAVFMVFAGHFASVFGISPLLGALPLFRWSWAGVDLFFVLSGYLIGIQLWKELNATGTLHIGRFILRRGFRIWPLYYSVAGLLCIERLLHLRERPGLLADLLFVSNYASLNQISGGWSLSTEEQFYIVAPVLFWLLSRILKPSVLWIAPLAAVLGGIGARAHEIAVSTLNEHDLRQKMYLPIHTHSDGLAIGLLIAWAWVFLPEKVHSASWRRGVALLMAGVGAGLYAWKAVLFNFTSLGLIFGACVVIGAGLERPPAFIRHRAFYVGSRLSYGVYLNHFGLLHHLGQWLGPFAQKAGEFGYLLLLAGSFAISLAIASVGYRLIEGPFLRLRGKLLSHSPANRGSVLVRSA